MNLSYFDGIPNPPNNPSNDVSSMQTNTNSISSLINVDHYGFNDNNGGRHRQVQLVTLGSIPAGLGTTQGTLYTKVAGNTNLFYTNGNSGNEYQLTRVTGGQITTFGTNTNYQAATGTTPSITGGWTFLPGGMYLMYGQATSANLSTNNNIVFPFAFSSFVASINLGPVRNNTTDKVVSISTGSVSTSGFQLILSGSSLPTSVYWTAIGV